MERSVVIDINAFIAGLGNIGIAESFKSAAVKLKTLSQNTGAGEASIAYGAVESLDTEAKFKALPRAVFKEMAKLDKAEIIYKKAVKTGAVTDSFEWICRGSISLEYGESKAGEYLDVTLTQKGLRAYTHEVNNKVVVDIDHDNMKCEIGGKDLLAETRNIIQG